MSRRIDDAIDLLITIGQLHEAQPDSSVAQLRLQAIDAVAGSRSIHSKTIADIYIRRLKPYVTNTGEFDVLVARWLNGHPVELKAALEKRALDVGDDGRIRAFFDASPVRESDER